jgi:hypothetical protein
MRDAINANRNTGKRSLEVQVTPEHKKTFSDVVKPQPEIVAKKEDLLQDPFYLASKMDAILKQSGISQSKQREAIKLLASHYDLIVSSRFAAPVSAVQKMAVAESSAKAPSKGKKAKPQPKADPQKVALRKEVDKVNSLIKAASQKSGGKLPETHPLLQERAKVFSRLHAFNAIRSSDSRDQEMEER